MLRGSGFPAIVLGLDPMDFENKKYATIWTAVQYMLEKNTPIDEVSLFKTTKELGNGIKQSELLEMTEECPTHLNIDHRAKCIKEDSDARQCKQKLNNAIEIANSAKTPAEAVAGVLDSVSKIEEARGADTIAMKDMVMTVSNEVEERCAGSRKTHGLLTGYYDLDRASSGLHDSELTVLAARPSMGKSAFALNVTANVARKMDDGLILFVSLEMSAKSLVERMASGESGVPLSDIRGRIDAEQYDKFLGCANQLSKYPFAINEKAQDAKAIAAAARTLPDVRLVIIDYLQLMKPPRKRDNASLEVGDTAKALKNVAKDLNIPIVVLSQLNRNLEQRENKRPRMSDLRQSGEIEEAADQIWFLYRDDYYKREASQYDGRAELDIAKNRNGPTGTAHLQFDKECARFRNLATAQKYGR
jgi:replicative DNA helicase